jgi:hypothetical protein
VIMEFPLWGDTDFGAMQLGSPLRYLMNLKECVPDDVRVSTSRMIEAGNVQKKAFAPLPVTVSTRCACLDFESNSLCAVVTEGGKHITLEWRKKGTMNIVSRNDQDFLGTSSKSRERANSDLSVATTISMDSTERCASVENSHDGEIAQFSDWSIIPLPLSLPSLHLPATTHADEFISLLKWWPDENFGGPPKLFAVTSAGTLILYEMPPPWSALEPFTPDPFTLNAIGDSFHSGDHGSFSDLVSCDDSKHGEAFNEAAETTYDVQVTPHSDFGLGLRLEAQADGMAAIAGSYKKHPLTGGRLPAEKTGKIVLGDELISVNKVSLEGMTFDDIIDTVRPSGEPRRRLVRSLERYRYVCDVLS